MGPDYSSKCTPEQRRFVEFFVLNNGDIDGSLKAGEIRYRAQNKKTISERLLYNPSIMCYLKQYLEKSPRACAVLCENDQFGSYVRGLCELTYGELLGNVKPAKAFSVPRAPAKVIKKENVDLLPVDVRESLKDPSFVREFWGSVLISKDSDIKDRIRVSELLAKSLGMFDRKGDLEATEIPTFVFDVPEEDEEVTLP